MYLIFNLSHLIFTFFVTDTYSEYSEWHTVQGHERKVVKLQKKHLKYISHIQVYEQQRHKAGRGSNPLWNTSQSISNLDEINLCVQHENTFGS